MEKKKRDKCLKMHLEKYKISQGKDGRWRTRVPTNDGLKMIAKTSRDDLVEEVISHYMRAMEVSYFGDVFEKWISEREEFHEIRLSSITRYKTDFKRFFPKNEPFCKIPMDEITEKDLIIFIKKTINNFHLTKKTYAGLRTILISVFKFAKREQIVDFSISTFFNDFSIPDNIFKKTKRKKDEEQVFSLEETPVLLSYLKNHPTIHNLGLLLMFQTGLRVGELVALKWEDIDENGMRLSVNSTEISFDNEDGKRVFEVENDTKTDESNRIIYLPKQALDTISELKKLNPNEKGFIFVKNGKRIRSKWMNYYIRKACREVGIPERSTHKIRKTYASTLILNKVDEKLIQKQMGHTDIATTRKYYDFYIVTNESQLRDQITMAIPY